jgi:predicted phosphodiesterase
MPWRADFGNRVGGRQAGQGSANNAMRVIVTADLHYNIARSKAPAEALATEICAVGGDILLFVGDCVSTDLTVLDELLGRFAPFRGTKLLVAGNHELWTCGGDDSLKRYEDELRSACQRNGVHYLDAQPYQADGVAFVGKLGPGAARQLESHHHLIEKEDDLPPIARDVTTRWMDGVRVRLPMNDVEFTRYLADKLRRHLEESQSCADRIIVGIHHLPFAELVPRSIIPNWAFANAFMGSDIFGELLLDYPGVSHAFCGHSHQQRRLRRGHVECINIGSTYREKRYEVLDV